MVDIVLTKLEQTCLAAPSQWDGWSSDGTKYYIRFRNGYLTVQKDNSLGEYLYTSYSTDEDSFITWEEVEKLTGIRYNSSHP